MQSSMWSAAKIYETLSIMCMQVEGWIDEEKLKVCHPPCRMVRKLWSNSFSQVVKHLMLERERVLNIFFEGILFEYIWLNPYQWLTSGTMKENQSSVTRTWILLSVVEIITTQIATCQFFQPWIVIFEAWKSDCLTSNSSGYFKLLSKVACLFFSNLFCKNICGLPALIYFSLSIHFFLHKLLGNWVWGL